MSDKTLREVEKSYDYQHWYSRIPEHSRSILINLPNHSLEDLEGALEGINIPLPWFIRLTSRSPKDAGDDSVSYTPEACKVEEINQVVSILSQSKRAKEDLEEYRAESAKIALVIQPWNPLINLAEELRLFVFHNRLVAVSAVDEPNVELLPESLEKLKEYVEKLPLKDHGNYVADICYLQKQDRVIFIEINPYEPELTDGILFDWEEDKAILFPDNESECIYRRE